MTATATALDDFLGGLPQPAAKPVLEQRLAVFSDGKKWKASYRTPSGFRHVDLGTVAKIHDKAAAEARADEMEKC